MNDFLSFRKMVTPLFIQVIFWLFALFAVISALYMMFAQSFVVGLVMLVVGPLMIRIYCELLIILFRIYDELYAIRTGVSPDGQGQGFPVTPMPPAQPTVTTYTPPATH